MRSDFLPFSRPTIDEDDIAAVGDVLRADVRKLHARHNRDRQTFPRIEFLGDPERRLHERLQVRLVGVVGNPHHAIACRNAPLNKLRRQESAIAHKGVHM